MSNKLKKEIKNKWVKVKGFYHTKQNARPVIKDIECIITNDKVGKTLSVVVGEAMITIPFETIEEYLK